MKIFKEEYESIENLKRIFKEGKGNMKMNLDDWKYFPKHPDEKVEDGETFFIK